MLATLQKALAVIIINAVAAACLAAGDPPANVMAMGAQYPDVTRALAFIQGNKDLTAYLSNPGTVCTFFAPTNEAMQESTKGLGKYVGIVGQNATLQDSIFNYHVVPGQVLTPADLSKLQNKTTRANETLWFQQRQNETYAYSRAEYPVDIEQPGIQAGKCVVYTIPQVLVPPSAADLIQVWLVELGTLPDPALQSEWAPVRTPQQAEFVEATLARLNGTTANATATTAGAGSASQAASSAAGLHVATTVGMTAFIMGMLAASML
eukprot:GHRR01015198.1.p1 GENE.GHRR01015198.1~~GHRR01015198.1.p1  ORF type:complete len:265 (+),score=83.45 GHRR01015198.1:285-1079(+)